MPRARLTTSRCTCGAPLPPLSGSPAAVAAILEELDRAEAEFLAAQAALHPAHEAFEQARAALHKCVAEARAELLPTLLSVFPEDIRRLLLDGVDTPEARV